jgi:hypothetical protein
MRRNIPAFALLLVALPSLSQTRSLVGGDHTQIDGTVVLERKGNSAYIVIKPGQPYVAVFDQTDLRTVREIGLAMEGVSESLKALVGQKVAVSGVIQLDPASPYYFNGALIIADSIRLPNGSFLTPKVATEPESPVGLEQFHALVTFTPHSAERWTYRTWDNNGMLLPSSRRDLRCGLNGPGDVMNCFCPAGFSYTATGTIKAGHFTKTQESPKDAEFAQFAIADPVRRSFSKALECTRHAAP